MFCFFVFFPLSFSLFFFPSPSSSFFLQLIRIHSCFFFFFFLLFFLFFGLLFCFLFWLLLFVWLLFCFWFLLLLLLFVVVVVCLLVIFVVVCLFACCYLCCVVSCCVVLFVLCCVVLFVCCFVAPEHPKKKNNRGKKTRFPMYWGLFPSFPFLVSFLFLCFCCCCCWFAFGGGGGLHSICRSTGSSGCENLTSFCAPFLRNSFFFPVWQPPRNPLPHPAPEGCISPIRKKKLLKTRALELPFFEGSLPCCSPHSAGYTHTFLHPYFPITTSLHNDDSCLGPSPQIDDTHLIFVLEQGRFL